MTKELCASERRTIDQVMALLPEYEATMDQVLREVSPHCERVRPGAHVLELGAAQGLFLNVLRRSGYDACGIEPWEPAIETGREVARRTGVETDIRQGRAEDLPFEEDQFDFVFALSVMEHVRDPMAVFSEVHRVLEPGGGFYFHTTSALQRRQNEIRGFPLFPMYPAPLQRRIMDWAAHRHPSWVGGTMTPAINWFTPWGLRRDLRSAGFRAVVERWDLKHNQFEGLRGRAVNLARSSKPLRLAGEFAKPGSGWLAIK
jgi:SAM-dependent methyltransferase